MITQRQEDEVYSVNLSQWAARSQMTWRAYCQRFDQMLSRELELCQTQRIRRIFQSFSTKQPDPFIR